MAGERMISGLIHQLNRDDAGRFLGALVRETTYGQGSWPFSADHDYGCQPRFLIVALHILAQNLGALVGGLR